MATPADIARVYDRMEPEARIEFLVLVIHQMTIAFRTFYSDTPRIVSSESNSAIGRLNEIQHRLAGLVLALLRHDLRLRPGQDVMEAVMSWAEPAQLGPLMEVMEDSLLYMVTRGNEDCAD